MVAILGLLFAGAPTHAQKSASDAIAAAKGLKCVFPLVAIGTWKNGEPQADVKTAALSIRFDSIRADEGTARLLGGFGGAADIVVRLSTGTLHFMQVMSAGPVYMTTVFDKESRDGKLKAVHTRHEYTDVSLPGFTSRPEQYYGECEVE